MLHKEILTYTIPGDTWTNGTHRRKLLIVPLYVIKSLFDLKSSINREIVTSDFHVTLSNSNCGTSALSSIMHAQSPVKTANTTTHNKHPACACAFLAPYHACSQFLSFQADAMISSGFTNAPVSQFLVFSTVIGALLATLTDTRYYLHIQVVPHIWGYGQFWRFLTWQACISIYRGAGMHTLTWTCPFPQTCFTNSTEVLFGVLTFYQLRVIERLWGSRKFAVRFPFPPTAKPTTAV